MVVAGIVFASTSWLRRCSSSPATIGVISPTGNEVGPFLADRAGGASARRSRTRAGPPTFAWYNLAGYVATAIGRARRRAPQPGAARRRARRRSTPTARSSSATRSIGLADGARASGGSARPSRRRRPRPRRRHPAPARTRALARASSLELSVAVLARRLRRRLHPAEPDGLLVPPPVRRRAGASSALIFFGANLLAAVSSLSAAADRGPDRAHQHDGLHPPAVERPADPRPAHADAAARDRRPARSASASARWTSRPASRT